MAREPLEVLVMKKPRAPSTYQKRRRWREPQARAALAALERSGLDLHAFAAREGLDPQRLTRWRRRLASPADTPTFEELVPPATSPSPEGAAATSARERFEIVLPSGRVVRVPASFEAHALQRLLAVVDAGRSC